MTDTLTIPDRPIPISQVDRRSYVGTPKEELERARYYARIHVFTVSQRNWDLLLAHALIADEALASQLKHYQTERYELYNLHVQCKLSLPEPVYLQMVDLVRDTPKLHYAFADLLHDN